MGQVLEGLDYREAWGREGRLPAWPRSHGTRNSLPRLGILEFMISHSPQVGLGRYMTPNGRTLMKGWSRDEH